MAKEMILTRIGKIPESDFCWIFERMDALPWFISRIHRNAEQDSWVPTAFDVQMAAKDILLKQGLAATGYLVERCKENHRQFSTPVRSYRLPTSEETAAAVAQAIAEVWVPYLYPELASK